MRYFRDISLALDHAADLARRNTRDYYVAQDSRSALVRVAVVTKLTLLRTHALLPASYRVRPETHTRGHLDGVQIVEKL